MNTSPPLTPCIQLCVLDNETGLCLGCGRTGEEIGAWGSLDNADRRTIMAQLPDRLARLADDRSARGSADSPHADQRS